MFGRHRSFIMTTEERKEMQKKYDFCINDLKYALENVDKEYISWTMGNISPNNAKIIQAQNTQDKSQDDDITRKYCERVFAYELYHQFRKLMYSNDHYNDLFLNGEQQKDNSHFNELLKSFSKNKIIPDLILHRCCGSIDMGGQILYIEIKTKNNTAVCDDLQKLTDLTKTKLNFAYYVFIYVDGTFEELKKRIKGYHKQYDDMIHCICVKNKKACSKSMQELKKEIEDEENK